MRIPQPADTCFVVWHTAAVVVAMPTPWNAGFYVYMHAHPQQGGGPHVAAWAYDTAAVAAFLIFVIS